MRRAEEEEEAAEREDEDEEALKMDAGLAERGAGAEVSAATRAADGTRGELNTK